jgi:hypothetical protein
MGEDVQETAEHAAADIIIYSYSIVIGYIYPHAQTHQRVRQLMQPPADDDNDEIGAL